MGALFLPQPSEKDKYYSLPGKFNRPSDSAAQRLKIFDRICCYKKSFAQKKMCYADFLFMW